jgi:cbb3-type cytochrome oxidase maturation protein
MEVIIVLILISVLVAGSFLIAFLYNLKNGQWDDTATPQHRILFDDGTKDYDEQINNGKLS